MCPINSRNNSQPLQNWETVRFCRGRINRLIRWRLCSWLFSLVWFVLSKKPQLSQKPQRYWNSADLGEVLGSVSVTEKESLVNMDDQLVYVCICVYIHTYCDTHIYVSIIQHSIFLIFVCFFHLICLYVRKIKANMLSFRELWFVMVLMVLF